MPLSFGVHIPTCIEGMMFPIPFARAEDILPTALLCERLGFDSVWVPDHTIIGDQIFVEELSVGELGGTLARQDVNQVEL